MNTKMLYLTSFLCLLTYVSCTQWDLFFPKHGLSPLIKPQEKAGPVFLSSIDQPLDNFDSDNDQRWNMRYMYNGEFFIPGGPIFVMLGGEWTIQEIFLQDGQMYDMAKQNGAYMLYTEHRFYGDSIPTEAISTPYLNDYLNTDQALADVINLIRRIKADIPQFTNSKVVVFGGSYAGNMAIWIREKYPDDIFAAVSSSAPVLSKVDFGEYFEVVQTVLGKDCSDVISRAIDQILQLFGTPKGALKVQRDFNTCKPVNTNKPLEMASFFQVIAALFTSLVQFNSCGRAQQICNTLVKIPLIDDYTKLATLFRNSPECIPTYPQIKEYITDVNIVPGRFVRQWLFQACYQFGFMQVTSSENQPFRNTIPLDAYQTFCSEFYDSAAYKPSTTRLGVDRTNLIFGGLTPNVTRVVSVHGRSDPWHTLGLKEDLNPLAPVILVKGASHTFDLASINECDNEEMIAAKLTVQRLIKEWLNSK